MNNMLTISSGNDQVRVSRLVLGVTSFGVSSKFTDDDYFRKLDVYFAAGGNTLDTGRVYGTEAVIGEWLKARRNRDKVILCSKGGCTDLATGHRRLSRAELDHDLEQSLRNLKVDHVDIYYLHRDDPTRPVEELLTTLHRYVSAGKVRLLGASNWSTSRLAEANACAAARGLTPFAVSQPCWSLGYTDGAHYDPEFAYLDDAAWQWYLSSRLPIMAHSSQANGYFAKQLAGEELSENIRRRYDFPLNRQRLERVGKLADLLQVSPTAIVIGYITGNAVNAAAVVGYNPGQQEAECLAAMNFRLTPEQIADLHG